MGIIQGSINNLITLSVAAVKLSPRLKKQSEIKSLEKDGGDSSEYVNPISYEEKLVKKQKAIHDSMIDLDIKQNEIRNSRRREIKPCLV